MVTTTQEMYVDHACLAQEDGVLESTVFGTVFRGNHFDCDQENAGLIYILSIFATIRIKETVFPSLFILTMTLITMALSIMDLT